jgi:hypothetical protein
MTNDRNNILEAYKDQRVADVRDGMDCLHRHQQGSLSPDIRPLKRMRAFGIARTCRYIPYKGKIPGGYRPTGTVEEYWQWSDKYYQEICS